ncbi:L-seryl-tRNA(Sec) kinase isoform X2 [Sphaerodactylus townsendi]|uniref:L-seryl-tRNA(Sec) kinase isoform X2 n=1 Tax=Sphaerodactylus townsendi TaxID=933632 RepID=UPI002025ED83|nr:L-seryl-tRNA(Sec) kinase isoform X2 [Sphaerodactylus townsendi]
MTQALGNAPVWPMGLCVLCGLPAAGKTTAARALRDSTKQHKGWFCVHLPYDDLMPPEAFSQSETSSGQEEPQSLASYWKLYRHELLAYLEHFLQALIKGCHYLSRPKGTEVTWKNFVCCLKDQGLIYLGPEDTASCQYLINSTPHRPTYFILDDNFYYRSMRYEVYQLARKYCQLEVCLQRNFQRMNPLSEETIHAMVQKLEVPNSEKYTWEQNSLILKSTEYTLKDNSQVFSLLSAALENPVKQFEENTELKEVDRALCAASFLHQADQAVRRIVSQTMMSAKDNKLIPSKMKSLAQELNKLKAEFLEDLKQQYNEKKQCHSASILAINTSLFCQQAGDIAKKYLLCL